MSRLEEIAERPARAYGGPRRPEFGVLLSVEERDWLLAEVVRLTEERDRALDVLRSMNRDLDSPRPIHIRCEKDHGESLPEHCRCGYDGCHIWEARAVLAEIGATPATYE